MNGSRWMVLFSPREKFPQVVASQPLVVTLVFASIWGMSRNLSEVLDRGMANAGIHWHDAAPDGVAAFVLVQLLAGIPTGIGIIWGCAWILRRSTRWMGGEISDADMRTVFAWSCAPELFNVCLFLLLIVLYRSAILIEGVRGRPVTSLCFHLAAVVSGIWQITLFIKGISTVGKLSTGRAALAFIAGIAICGVVIVLATFGWYWVASR